MPKKATPKRRKNFPLIFWEGLRERAEVIAADKHGTNLTALVNTAVNEYVQREERKNRK